MRGVRPGEESGQERSQARKGVRPGEESGQESQARHKELLLQGQGQGHIPGKLKQFVVHWKHFDNMFKPTMVGFVELPVDDGTVQAQGGGAVHHLLHRVL